MTLKFEKSAVVARALSPSGELLEQPVEIRIHPVSGRTCRIAFARSGEREAATESLPPPPPSKKRPAPFAGRRCSRRRRALSPIFYLQGG